MQLYYVLIVQDMISLSILAVVNPCAPYPCEF